MSVVVARVPFPCVGPDEFVAAVLGAVTARTRGALLDHVSSPTALVFPIAELVRALTAHGVDTLSTARTRRDATGRPAGPRRDLLRAKARAKRCFRARDADLVVRIPSRDRGLRGAYRCIATDHLGFGLSSGLPTPHTRPRRTPIACARSSRAWAWTFTLVVHDFGGPIALPLALADGSPVSRLVILNAGCGASPATP